MIVHRIQPAIASLNPSPIVLKITSPGTTPDTTTAFDGEAVVCRKPPPISKPEEPTDRRTHGGYLRGSTSDPTPSCARFQALHPLTRASALKCGTCPSITQVLGGSSPRTGTVSRVRASRLRRGCFNLGLDAPPPLPLASLTNAFVSDRQAFSFLCQCPRPAKPAQDALAAR